MRLSLKFAFNWTLSANIFKSSLLYEKTKLPSKYEPFVAIFRCSKNIALGVYLNWVSKFCISTPRASLKRNALI